MNQTPFIYALARCASFPRTPTVIFRVTAAKRPFLACGDPNPGGLGPHTVSCSDTERNKLDVIFCMATIHPYTRTHAGQAAAAPAAAVRRRRASDSLLLMSAREKGRGGGDGVDAGRPRHGRAGQSPGAPCDRPSRPQRGCIHVYSAALLLPQRRSEDSLASRVCSRAQGGARWAASAAARARRAARSHWASVVGVIQPGWHESRIRQPG